MYLVECIGREREYSTIFRIPLTTALFIQMVLTSMLVAVLFMYHMFEWSSQNEQLEKIKVLASNPQTTLQEQRKLFTDVRTVLSNQERILDNQQRILSQTNGANQT
jgi:hypothetical protein